MGCPAGHAAEPHIGASPSPPLPAAPICGSAAWQGLCPRTPGADEKAVAALSSPAGAPTAPPGTRRSAGGPGPGAVVVWRSADGPGPGAGVERRLAGDPGPERVGARACAGRAPFGAGGEGVNARTGGLIAMGAAARRGRAEGPGGTPGHPAGAWGGAPVVGRGG
ncbi:translation initiation factor IF-2 [Streptomyces malaysiensis]|uniref:Translation initiation factor IF-2 n=1 Tax=Streptomyces malaysiensis TaxID=92644 RepID=A0A7X5X8H6_STRMQ|nr:translation initiation factor IF-2 [Streptomyces malaysiensis]